MIEMVIVMAIMTVVLTGLTTVFVSGSKAELDMNKRFAAQQEVRLGLDKIRRDIHCAATLTPSTPTTSVQINSPSCGQTFYWCVANSTKYANRWALYRNTASPCTSGVIVADGLLTTSGNPFTIVTTTGQLQKLRVHLVASIDANGRERYDLQDDIVLLNSTRA